MLSDFVVDLLLSIVRVATRCLRRIDRRFENTELSLRRIVIRTVRQSALRGLSLNNCVPIVSSIRRMAIVVFVYEKEYILLRVGWRTRTDTVAVGVLMMSKKTKTKHQHIYTR